MLRSCLHVAAKRPQLDDSVHIPPLAHSKQISLICFLRALPPFQSPGQDHLSSHGLGNSQTLFLSSACVRWLDSLTINQSSSLLSDHLFEIYTVNIYLFIPDPPNSHLSNSSLCSEKTQHCIRSPNVLVTLGMNKHEEYLFHLVNGKTGTGTV